MSYGNSAGGGMEIASVAGKKRESRRSWAAKGLAAPVPMHQPAPVNWGQNSIASAYVRWDFTKIGKEEPSSKRRD
jgi:hypothetical protein